MAKPSELANSANALSRAELRKLNNYLSVGISESELGATSEIQTLASNINALNGADRLSFSDTLGTVSGGIKDKHWPC